MGGFENDVMLAKNMNFDPAAAKPHLGILNAAGKLPIGTGNSSPTPEILAGSITSPLGTLSIGYNSPNITIDVGAGFNDLHVAKWIVNPVANSGGNQTTIQGAINAAVSGETIFIYPGTYTENITLKAGVNLTAFGSDSSLNATGKVIISGTCTMTTAGTVTISGIQLQTNSAALLAVTGSAASIVNLNNCYLNCTNATGITYSSSSASSAINIYDCQGNIGTTGISLATVTSTGLLRLKYTRIFNSGNTTTATTTSQCPISASYCLLTIPFTTSSTGILNFDYNSVDTSAGNSTCMTAAGTGSISALFCFLSSGTASAFSIGAGCTGNLNVCNINSSNTNAITGAGTFNGTGNTYSGSSLTNNVTTQTTAGTIAGIRAGNAPSAGLLGERLESTATAVATTSATAKTIASVSLTAGVWDVSLLATALPTGGTATSVELVVGISNVNNTLVGTLGIEQFQIDGTFAGAVSGSVPSYRVTLSATTTYYLIVKNTYTSTTCPTNGRISATRVG